MGGKLIIITGPTASGKDAIMHHLLKENPGFLKIVTATTRSPRRFEKEGVDHYFLSRQRFDEMKQKGELLETNEYSGNLYGTPKSEFEKTSGSSSVLWRVDATMAARAKDFFNEHFERERAQKLAGKTAVIYIDSPEEFLRGRLKRRGMPDEEVERRIAQDRKNWEACKDKFDHVLLNEEGKLEETIKKVVEIIQF